MVAHRVQSAVPAGLLADLAHIDKLLSRLIGEVRGGSSGSGAETIDRIAEIEKAKREMVLAYFDQRIYGLKLNEVFFPLDCLDRNLGQAIGVIVGTPGAQVTARVADSIARSQKCKQRLENKLQKVAETQKVTISEDDTWAHNPAIGKSRICINVRTSPPQASVSATITGPEDYRAEVGKSPLHADGKAQVSGIITKAGDYTKTLVVYDSTGKQTATVTKTFTVAEPPQDGPITDPPCVKPTE